MNSVESVSRDERTVRRFLRFSLRAWFVFLTLFGLAVVVGNWAWRRRELERQIYLDGSLVYRDTPRHAKAALLIESTALHGRSPTPTPPSPRVGLRDSRIPWISQWSGGSAVFCPFDSMTYSVSNVKIPDWVNDVIATGELRRVSLRLNHGNIDVNQLTRCRELEQLTLSGRTQDPHALRDFHRLTKLQNLTIYSWSELEYDQVLPHGLPANLIELRMPNCNLRPRDMAILKNCRNLEVLDLTGNPIDLQALSAGRLSPQLKSVTLSKTRCGVPDLQLLAACRNLTQLTFLVDGADLRNVDGLDLPGSLELLSLKSARLDASTFRWLSRLKNLKSLTINSCRFEDAAAEGIEFSSSLQRFSAMRTNAGHHVARAVAGATELRSLKLRASQVDDAALRAFGGKEKLTELGLGETQVTDASADWIGRLRQLDSLDLRETVVGDRLFEQAPHLQQVGRVWVDDTNVSPAMRDAISKNARW
ncbi:MAG: hypothetical protein QGG36_14350 [Pirellulaceae bacterium]|nr:hypothetical protein [Pirellulaceae bacterium]